MMRHPSLAAGRWFDFSLVQQMANVGSEVERSIRAREAGMDRRFENAFERTMELFDLTVADPRWRGPRLRELTRAREEFRALFFGDDGPWPTVEPVRRYYLQFAIAARIGNPTGGGARGG